MKLKCITAIISLSAVLLSSQLTFAKTDQPWDEEIQRKKDKLMYKAYVPAKYTLFEAIQGDLNKDGVNDLVLIVKGTDPKQWVNNEDSEKLDRNRRGIIVLLNKQGAYKKLTQNLSAFSSENEEGGGYFAPELTISIEKGLLKIFYGHGRYGWWSYSFRLDSGDFKLIGYDYSNNFGGYVKDQTSINFNTGKRLYKKNMIEDEEKDPSFKETWTKGNYQRIYLSQIKDFDELRFE